MVRAWHMAFAANAAGNRHGVDHHPDLCRAGLHRDLHQFAARAAPPIATSRSSASTTSRTVRSRGRSGCSRTPTRSCRCRTRSTGRTSTTAAWQAASGEYLLFLNDDIEMQPAGLAGRTARARAAAGGGDRGAAAAVSRTARCSTPACSLPRGASRATRSALPRRTSPAISAWR